VSVCIGSFTDQILDYEHVGSDVECYEHVGSDVERLVSELELELDSRLCVVSDADDDCNDDSANFPSQSQVSFINSTNL